MAKKKYEVPYEEQLMNHREVAAKFGVHPGTVQRWMEEGTIPKHAVVRLPGGARPTGEGLARGNSVRYVRHHIDKLFDEAHSRGINFSDALPEGWFSSPGKLDQPVEEDEDEYDDEEKK